MPREEKPYTIQGKVVHARTQEPLVNHLVRAFDVDRPGEDDYLGEGETNQSGEFAIRYKRTDFVKTVLESFAEGDPDLVLRVYDPQGKRRLTTRKRTGAARFENYVIKLPDPIAPGLWIPLDEVGKAARIPDRATKALQQKGIVEIKDLLTSDGLQRIQDLDLEQAERRRLLAVAKFAALSNDLSIAQKLEAKGITSLTALGRAPRRRIEKLLEDPSDKDREVIHSMHSRAKMVGNYVVHDMIVRGRAQSRDHGWHVTTKVEENRRPE